MTSGAPEATISWQLLAAQITCNNVRTYGACILAKLGPKSQITFHLRSYRILGSLNLLLSTTLPCILLFHASRVDLWSSAPLSQANTSPSAFLDTMKLTSKERLCNYLETSCDFGPETRKMTQDSAQSSTKVENLFSYKRHSPTRA